MDTSNPVISADRMSLVDVHNQSLLRRRQNLSALQSVASTAQRIFLPVNSDKVERDIVVSLVDQLKRKVPEVKEGPEVELDTKAFALRYDSLPVCGAISTEGEVLHPPGINQKQGSVQVHRTFGGVQRDPLGIIPFVEIVGQDVLEVGNKVYTYGTRSGFHTRLNEQMGRKTVPWSEAWQHVLGVKVASDSFKMFQERVLVNIPLKMRSAVWPSLKKDLLEQLKCIHTTANSSAGAPYWRNKVDCTPEVLNVGIPMICKAMEEPKGLDRLFKEEPEMFLVEVKNKLDRYDSAEVQKKTRPYTCVPAHFSFLFSVLCQRFQERLATFVSDRRSCNAYGFSSAGGGLMDMVEWMESTEEHQMKFICYGDDSRIVWRRNGELWMVNPDFKQMDGSVDYEVMKMTIQWVYKTLCDEDGLEDEPFWRNIADLWLFFASSPFMIIDGTKVWQKKNKGGLMTGVTGTTLFDTVKAISSWAAFRDAWKMGMVQIEDPTFVSKWMLKHCGLVVKEGTWDPVIVKPWARVGYGELYCEQKFLGVQISKDYLDVPGYYQDLAVPTIPYEEMLEMFVVQKDNPFAKVKSSVTKARLLFDRCRGLFITFAFTDAEMVNAIHNVVNSIDSTAILMSVQTPGGAHPSSVLLSASHLVEENFSYPTSTGFPSEKFCRLLYARGVPEELRKAEWIEIYPALSNFSKELKTAERVRVVARPVKDNPQVVLPVYETVEPATSLQDIMESSLKPMASSQKVDFGKIAPNKRSKIQVVDPQGEVVSQPKRIPEAGEVVLKALERSGGISSLGEVQSQTGLSRSAIEKAAPKFQFVLSGMRKDDIVSSMPLQTNTSTSLKIISKMEATGSIGKSTMNASCKQAATDVRDLEVKEFIYDLIKPEELNKVPNIKAAFNQLLVKNELVASFKSGVPVQLKDSQNTTFLKVELFICKAPKNVKGPFRLCAHAVGPSRKICENAISQEIMKTVVYRHFKNTGQRLVPDLVPLPEEKTWAEEVEEEATKIPSIDQEVVAMRTKIRDAVQRFLESRGLCFGEEKIAMLESKMGVFMYDPQLAQYNPESLLDNLVLGWADDGSRYLNPYMEESDKKENQNLGDELDNPSVSVPSVEEVCEPPPTTINPFLEAIERAEDSSSEEDEEEQEIGSADESDKLNPFLQALDAIAASRDKYPEILESETETELSLEDLPMADYPPPPPLEGAVEAEEVLRKMEEVQKPYEDAWLVRDKVQTYILRSEPIAVPKRQVTVKLPKRVVPQPRLVIPEIKIEGKKKRVRVALTQEQLEKVSQKASQTYTEAVKKPIHLKNAKPTDGPPAIVGEILKGSTLPLPQAKSQFEPFVMTRESFPEIGKRQKVAAKPGNVERGRKQVQWSEHLIFKDESLVDQYADIAHNIGLDAKCGAGVAKLIKQVFPGSCPLPEHSKYLKLGVPVALDSGDGLFVYSIPTKPLSVEPGLKNPGPKSYLENFKKGLEHVMMHRASRGAEGYLHVPGFIGAGRDKIPYKDVWTVIATVAKENNTKIVLCFPPNSKTKTNNKDSNSLKRDARKQEKTSQKAGESSGENIRKSSSSSSAETVLSEEGWTKTEGKRRRRRRSRGTRLSRGDRGITLPAKNKDEKDGQVRESLPSNI